MAHLSLKHNIIKIFATTNHSSTKNPPNGGFYKIKDNVIDTSVSILSDLIFIHDDLGTYHQSNSDEPDDVLPFGYLLQANLRLSLHSV